MTFTYNFRTRLLIHAHGHVHFIDGQLAVCYLLGIIHAAERAQRGRAAHLFHLNPTN